MFNNFEYLVIRIIAGFLICLIVYVIKETLTSRRTLCRCTDSNPWYERERGDVGDERRWRGSLLLPVSPRLV